MKNKDICDNYPRCIMSCGLMVDDIIMDHIKRTQSSQKYTKYHDCFFYTDGYPHDIYIQGDTPGFRFEKKLMSVLICHVDITQ